MFKTRLVSALIVISVVAAACSDDSNSTSPSNTSGTATTAEAAVPGDSTPGATTPVDTQQGGVLVVAQSADPTSLNPYRFGSTNDRSIITNMFDTLVEFDLNSYEIVGSLAEKWSASEDGLDWTFNLRDGVTFHDGSTFDAADVVASIERAQAPESGRTTSLLTRVESVEAIDDLTVEVHLTEPDRILPLTLIDVYITPEDDSIDQGATPVGTGPFMFVSAEANQQVVLERNPNYWVEGLPHLDGIEFRTIPDATVQSLQIRTGDVDVLASAPLGEIGALQSAGVQIIGPADGFNSGFYHFHTNTRREPWSNQAVRQAASSALDRTAIARSLFGFMQVLSNPMEVRQDFFNADAMSYTTQDLDRSASLMAEAGFADGVDGGELIVCDLGFQFTTLAQLVQLQLAEVGINVEIQVLDVGTYVARTLGDDAGNFDLALCGMVPKPNEYDLLNHPYAKLFTKALGWIDQKPEFYTLLEDARSMTDDADYAAAIAELQVMAMEGQPEIIIGGMISPLAAVQGIDGLLAHTQGHLFLKNVTKQD
ncbi:MAG TPA: ABC transporter substrate-binding protein [Ilumatobacteraceae bacterium]|nr:ABC transporter substrate-binding protein [Ilumatobacteraceae bacterium]